MCGLVLVAISARADTLAPGNVAATAPPAADGDFDGDGSAEIAVYRPGAGAWYLLKSSTNFTGYAAYQWGISGDIAIPGDYDGDGKTDISVYRPAGGLWFILKSSTNFTAHVAYQWGVSGDVPIPGDYDGDGKTDVAIYRPSSGLWFILKSSTNFTGYVAYQWGVSGDVPTPGDYDGDGKTDVAIYRPAGGLWFILKSTTNFTAYVTYQWGVSGDVPIPGDYDGDGKSDIAVYRPSSGLWFILKSSTGFTGYLAYQWGVSGDVPTPGDFDGDGKSDVAVYRPSGGVWYILKSSTNFTGYVSYQWGIGCDVPVVRPRVGAVDTCGVPTQPSQISIVGRQVMVRRRKPDGSLAAPVAWVMRGVNWSPADVNTNTTSADPNNVVKRRPEFGDHYLTDIPLLKAMNVNTVRLFMDPGLPGDPNLTVPGLQVLDELYRAGIMAVITVDNGNNTVSRIEPAVNHFKNHPAVLMWSLGSEFNLNRFFGKFPTVDTAAQAMESAAQLVKAADAGHPVVASYGNLDEKPDAIEDYVNVVCPSIDVWSFNLYRGPGFARFFEQWGYISAKPMFLGEFGIDAWNSTLYIEDQATQAAWVGQLWDEIARNLSAGSPSGTALGGAVMEFQDEYWKIPPYNTQEKTGWNPPGFPDGTASEDVWGITTIDRTPRQVYFTLQQRFAPGYVPPPPPPSITYRAESGFGFDVHFWENGAVWYNGHGASLDGGRGFNIAAINRTTGRLIAPIQRFDTWVTRDSGGAMTAMNAFLDGVPNDTLLLIAVGDEAGLTRFPAQGRCTTLPYPWVSQALTRFAALGATLLNSYCYADRWSLITIKGQGVALDEALGASSTLAVSEATVPGPSALAALRTQAPHPPR